MTYVPNILEDVKEHKKYHDKIVNGIYARRIISDKIVWENGCYRITFINHHSPAIQKKRAQEAGSLAQKDTPFCFPQYHYNEALDERNVHNFLLYKDNRIIGYLIIEKRSWLARFTWEKYKKNGNKKLIENEPIWSVGLVWIHQLHTKKGLGSQLVKTVASFLNIEIQFIGWCTPFTADGEKLVRMLCPNFFYIAK